MSDFDKVQEELMKVTRKLCKVMTLDLFDGPDTIRTKEFLKILRGEEPTPIEEIRKQLDEWERKREEILNA